MEEEEEKDEEDDKEIETKKITKKKAKKRKTMMKKIMMTSKDDNKDINENENNKVVEDVENFHTVSSMSQKKRIQKGVLKIIHHPHTVAYEKIHILVEECMNVEEEVRRF
jgi:adenine-specific DNA glycosylase